MEDKFDQNEFEEFLQKQVRNQRMYPTDAVWREIDKKLHGEKRWPALTIAALLLLTTTVLICVYFTPKPNIFTIKPANESNSTPATASKNSVLNNLSSSVPFAIQKASGNTAPALSTNSTHVSSQNNEPTIAASTTVADRKILAQSGNTANIISAHPLSSVATTSATSKQRSETEQFTPYTNNNIIVDAPAVALSVQSNKGAATKKIKSPTVTSPTEKDYNDKNMVDDFLKDHKSDVALYTAPKKISLKHRFSYQIYVAPSVSYRKLLEDQSVLTASTNANNSGPMGLNYVTDVNKVVRHKPGTGIEAGFGILYNLSSNIRLKTGLQFNVRQYSIEAYKSNTELASIALAGSNGIDTVNTLAVYRTNNGYYSAELVNRYYQLSVPLGIEWQVLGNRSIQLNVAASIQPTYLLNRNAYLLSTNFKNYTESPEIVRKWNLNSNIETFISFRVGDFKWQLGPQLRYQPYSTFIHQYPIKEHLMDYGIKFGVSKLF